MPLLSLFLRERLVKRIALREIVGGKLIPSVSCVRRFDARNVVVGFTMNERTCV
jgi:hypothetical protein